MSTPPNPPASRLVPAVILIVLGRVILPLAVASETSHALWGWPPGVRRIHVALAVAFVLLGGAACLLREFRWFLRAVLGGFAVAAILIAGAVARVSLARSPHALTEREIWAGIVALVFAVGASLHLRRRKHRR